MSEQAMWFYESKGKREGSVPTTEIIELITQGVIHQGTQVWKKGMTEWVTLEDSELAQYLEDVPPPLSSNDVPPPLQTVLTPKSNEESFSTKLGGIWRFIYAPTFAAIVTYIVSFWIEGNGFDAFYLWSSTGMVLISLAISLIAWGEDLWRFKKSANYTGWSWWWLFAPCYIHDRMGKQWKWTIGLIVLSVVCSTIASAVITLHGDGYFDNNDSYNNQTINNTYSSDSYTTDEITQYLDRVIGYQTYVERISAGFYQYEYCTSATRCEQYYLKKTNDGYLCQVKGETMVEASLSNECESEVFNPRS